LDDNVDDIQPKVAKVAKYGSANAKDPTMTPPTIGELQNMTCPIPRDTLERNDLFASVVAGVVVVGDGVLTSSSSLFVEEYQQEEPYLKYLFDTKDDETFPSFLS
jgi:hypothetical protein